LAAFSVTSRVPGKREANIDDYVPHGTYWSAFKSKLKQCRGRVSEIVNGR